MRIPREVSGQELVKLLGKLGYKPTRQTGSHVRVTCISEKGEHHITIPQHGSLRIGTLNNIIADVASYLNKEKADIVDEIFANKR
ncbi:MAG: type II toxin-antitoxin system HicA family toxin [Syntrophobacteraceae bacterium]|nr:type II toxin-antitoxin system HicA family toxin [Syntrophobacteraceae bacterium]